MMTHVTQRNVTRAPAPMWNWLLYAKVDPVSDIWMPVGSSKSQTRRLCWWRRLASMTACVGYWSDDARAQWRRRVGDVIYDVIQCGRVSLAVRPWSVRQPAGLSVCLSVQLLTCTELSMVLFTARCAACCKAPLDSEAQQFVKTSKSKN